MQSTKLKDGMCDEIDKRVRNFIWGSTSTERKMHLVSWDTLCLPKEKGGLGFRSARVQNKLFLMKLMWRLMEEKDTLWSQVIRSKYSVADGNFVRFRMTGLMSYQWRSVLSVLEQTTAGLTWRLGDGKTTLFWHDNWLSAGLNLAELIPQEVWIPHSLATVADYVSDTGEWNWDLLQNVSEEVRLKIRTIKPPNDINRSDQLIWGGTANGRFSMSSAFKLLAGNEGEKDRTWSEIWKMQSPQRIKSFIWLSAHEALLTNQRRLTCRMADDATCPRCNSDNETVLHALRDCPFVEDIWMSLIPGNQHDEFFMRGTLDWIRFGLDAEKYAFSNPEKRWGEMFGFVAYNNWRTRNQIVFNNPDRSCEAPLAAAKRWAHEFKMAKQYCTITNNPEFPVHVSKWRAPPASWIKLNVDGAVCHMKRRAAIGGLIRYEKGSWITGFSRFIGDCSSLSAELWALLDGLKVAWDTGHKQVEVESDCWEAIQAINSEIQNPNQSFSNHLVLEVTNMVQRNWSVKFAAIP